MTLKHKTTGKWARGAAKHAQNPENKKLLNEHHKLGEELRRKVQGLEEDEEEDSLEYDSDGYPVSRGRGKGGEGRRRE
jgi:U3 small nucleolar RNA-associated protein 14